MAIPVIGALAAGLAGHSVGQSLGNLITPHMAFLQQVAWRKTPLLPPDTTALIAAHKRQLLSLGDARNGCKMQGINYRGSPVGAWGQNDRGGLARSWEAAAKLTEDLPTPDLITAALLRGILQEQDARDGLIRVAGNSRSWLKLEDMFRLWIPPGTVAEAQNREWLREGEYSDLLKKYGGYSDRVIELLDRLRWNLPPISDLIRFAVKDVFDPQIVRDQKLLGDYPEVLTPFAEALGYKTLNDAADNLGLRQTDLTIPEMYWAAHWQPISPTQSYEMLHRLRPDNADRWPAFLRGRDPFIIDNVRQWLRISDYPPAIRDYLAAISYRVIGRVDLRRMHKIGVIDDADLRSRYQDLGYTVEDADAMARFTIQLNKSGTRKAYIEPFRREILKSYQLGAITYDRAFEQLVNTEQVETEPAEKERKSQVLLQTVDLRAHNEQLARAIKAVRQDFLEGAITEPEANNQLVAMGLTPQRTNELLNFWRLDLTRPRRVESSSKIIEWYKKGLITGDEASNRLYNLGWSQPNVFLYLSGAELDLAKARAAEEMRQARSEAQRQKALHSAADHADLHQKWARSLLSSHSSPAYMKRWLKRGLIDEQTVRSRLTDLGWPGDDQDRFIQEAANGRQ